MHSREQRRADIIDLVRRHRLRSQAELRRRLTARGVAVNQATLSRDLRDLGVRKGPQGYELPNDAAVITDGSTLRHAVAEWMLNATPVQHQVVVKTPPGGASPLALALDRAAFSEVVGTLAGDDTALLICHDARTARRMATRLRALQEQESAT